VSTSGRKKGGKKFLHEGKHQQKNPSDREYSSNQDEILHEKNPIEKKARKGIKAMRGKNEGRHVSTFKA